jgi:tetratricopeptide (TPR) repeat protein
MLIHAGVDGTLHEPALAVLLTVFAALLLSANQWADGRSRQPAAWTLAFPNHRLAVGAAGIGFLCMVVTSVAGIGVAWSAHEAGSQAADRRDYARAIAGYERAIAWDPGKALYHSSLGAAHYRTFLRTGQWSEAERSLAAVKTATALNPLDGRLWGLMGNLYVTMANATGTARSSSAGEGMVSAAARSAWLKAASSSYGAALEREPCNPFYRLELARLKAREQEWTEAEAMLHELLALEPNFLPGRALLAEVFVTLGRDQAARDVYRDIVARQQQFAHWTKDPLEQRYLDVDTNRLAGMVAREVDRL